MITFHMACEGGPSQWVSANGPNFVVTVQEWFVEEDISDTDVEVSCNEQILTSDHDAKPELSETVESEGYSTESSLLDKGSSFRKAFYGQNNFK